MPTDRFRYALYYWPQIPGRGEFVRLVLEAADAPYVDVTREPEEQGGGMAAMLRLMKDAGGALEPFAPPFLRSGELVIAQTALILHYLGIRHELVPADEPSRLRAQQIALTMSDLVVEVHDTHHPLGISFYYEEQKLEAMRRTRVFVTQRLPKFLSYFERVLAQNSVSRGAHFVGERLSYVDIALFQLLSGLDYAFPQSMERVAPRIPGLRRLHDYVAERPRIAAYLTSKRRLPFNEQGIFRHYPELDA